MLSFRLLSNTLWVPTNVGGPGIGIFKNTPLVLPRVRLERGMDLIFEILVGPSLLPQGLCVNPILVSNLRICLFVFSSLGLPCCLRASLAAASRGHPLAVVHWPPIARGSPVVERGL